MLIDWITARVASDILGDERWQKLVALGDRIVRFNVQTGEVVYETFAWDSVRSDSHQLVFRVGSDALWLQGSPARILGDGCAVFGTGPALKLDLAGCVASMVAYLSRLVGIGLPPAASWTVSRVDVTGNFLLDSQADVRVALATLRNCEGGRYRVSQQAGDTVYWSHRSHLRKAKAYLKGAHLRYQQRRIDYTGREYTEQELQAADKLLRLELTLCRDWFRQHCPRNSWTDVTAHQLCQEWDRYFLRMVGEAMTTDDKSLRAAVDAVAATSGQAKSAFALWLLIKHEGWEKARDITAKRTWYRNLKILHAAGLGDADISAGVVVPIRRRILECRLVHDWSEILAA